MSEAIATMTPVLANTLLHFVWQGLLIGVFAWMALAALHAARPQARYLVTCLALLACVLLPALTFALLWFDSADARTLALPALAVAAWSTADTSTVAIVQMLASPAGPAVHWIVPLWATGVVALMVRLGCGLWWVQRLRSGPACATAAHWQGCVDRMSARFGITRPVAVRVIDAGDSPLSVGWWAPVILLPAAVVARMPVPLLQALIAHELAHVRRHDYLINLLQGVVEALLFYHPVVWWLSHRLRVERELVADDLAARHIGDPRRLALALAELDRLSPARSPIPHTALAQAAHGGQLMSRIRQLLRPEHRIVGGTLLLPAVGIVALGIAFQSYAKLASPAPGGRDLAASYVAPPPPPPAAPKAPPPPPAPPAALPIPAMTVGRALPVPPPPPAAPVVPTATVALIHGRGQGSYALVREHRDGFRMSGDTGDIDDINAARRNTAGDFLWFRRGNEAWLVRDAGVLARVDRAWSGMRQHEARMQALHAEMQPHERRIEALANRIEGMHQGIEETPKVRAAERALEAIADRQAALAEEQRALGNRLRQADDAERAALDRRMQHMDARQRALAQQMERHAAEMQAQSLGLRARTKGMEEVSREMEASSRLMASIGKQMESVGSEIDAQATAADRQIRALIDDAVRRGLAEPAPSGR